MEKRRSKVLFITLAWILTMVYLGVVSSASADICPVHAEFDSSTKILTIPYLDVPLVDPISQQEITGQEAVFSCSMKYVSNSGGSFSIKDITYLPGETGDDCHAQYDYDGTLFIPNVDIITVITLPGNNIIEGPVETYPVTLQQLMLDSSYYHIVDSVGDTQQTTAPVLSGPSEGVEDDNIDIVIDNYSTTAQYTVNISGGTYFQFNDIVIWTLPWLLPDTGAVNEFTIEIAARESGMAVSEITTHTVTVNPQNP